MNNIDNQNKTLNNNGDMKNIFIIAGMPRSGTTFLYYTFLKHPSVFCPYRRESDFFSLDYGKGLDWYKQLYRDMQVGQVGADINPSYFFHPNAIERMRNFNPEVKVILTIRKPSDFCLSSYSQYLNYTWRVPPFRKFIEEYWLRGRGKISLELLKERPTATVINQYQEAFGRKLLLCDFALLQREPLKILLAIESFVGLPPYFNEHNVENVAINSGNRKNIKVISYLLSRELTISLLEKVPRRIVHFFHRAFLRAGRKKFAKHPKVYTPENIQLAQQLLAHDDDYVRELFSHSEIQLGDGSPFEPLR